MALQMYLCTTQQSLSRQLEIINAAIKLRCPWITVRNDRYQRFQINKDLVSILKPFSPVEIIKSQHREIHRVRARRVIVELHYLGTEYA